MASESTDEPSDESLMSAYAHGGDSSAFSQLYRRYETRLYGFLMRRLSQELRPATADLFQKTWLKVHGARREFDAKRAFSPWLFSIALNVLRDEWRIPQVVDEFDDPSDLDLQKAPQDDAERSLGLKQDFFRLEGALGKISGSQREALLLSEWEGFSTREVAEAMGVTEAAARQLVSRARRRVREIMTEEPNA